MRLIFVLCMVLCLVGATAPATTDPDVIVSVSETLAEDQDANPVDLFVASPTPSPTPSPEPVERSPSPAPKVAPTHTPTPSPKPTPTPTPTPKPTPTPTPRPTSSPNAGTTYSRDQVKEGIRRAWGGDDEEAIRVADCESGLNPRATSPDGRHLGLWQLRKETWETYGGSGDPRDASPEAQTNVAWRLYQQRGWSPWAGCAG